MTQNIALTLGAVSEAVEIMAGAELIQQASSDLGTVIPEKVVQDLPLNGRNFYTASDIDARRNTLQTSQTETLVASKAMSAFRFGFFRSLVPRTGKPFEALFYDGIINTNVRGPTYIVIPNIDLVQEFKVVGHDSRADFGGAAGGVVNMVSKSGGNDFHGSAFEYVRNDAFDARNPLTFAPRRAANPGRCSR